MDCSHDNALGKDNKRQPEVVKEVLLQRIGGNQAIVGIMLESFLVEGKYDGSSTLPPIYGISYTDACIGWETTEDILLSMHESL